MPRKDIIPTRENNPEGLHQRYIVSKVDGSPVDPEAIYLVLRIDRKGENQWWSACCRYAAYALVRFVEKEYEFREKPRGLHQFAVDLFKLLDETR